MKKLENGLKVKKITNKIELKDMEINADPCKIYYDKYDLLHEYDCDYDCGLGLLGAQASVAY